MRKNQLGIGLGGLLAGAVAFIGLATIGMKLGPSYLEFYAIKKAVNAIAQEKRAASVAEIRKTWDNRATIDDISSVQAADIEITKDGTDIVISANYRKEIPLAGNLGVYINFHASSKE